MPGDRVSSRRRGQDEAGCDESQHGEIRAYAVKIVQRAGDNMEPGEEGDQAAAHEDAHLGPSRSRARSSLARSSSRTTRRRESMSKSERTMASESFCPGISRMCPTMQPAG